jgi:hypothetical protein
MGFFYSGDGRQCTSTLDFPASAYLTPKGIKDTDAAIIIQRWWRNLKRYNVDDIDDVDDVDSYTSTEISSSREDFVKFDLRRRYKHRCKRKRKRESDIESDIVDFDSNTDLDVKLDELDELDELDSSELDESVDESLNEEDHELQAIVDNNFLWDFWFSLYNFIWKVLGY